MTPQWLRTRRLRRDFDAASARLTEALVDGAWPEAVAAGTEAVQHAVSLHGEDDAATVAPRYALAAAHLGANDLEAARDQSDRALAIARAHPVGLEPPLSMLYEQRLAIAERSGDTATIGRLLESLARAYDRMRAADPGAHASALHRWALHLARHDERLRAGPLFSRTLQLLEPADDAPETLSAAEVLYNRASLAPDDTPAAPRLADFDRARELSPPPALLARIEHNRATVLEASDPDAAVVAYEAALEAWPEPELARPTLVRLARLHHARRRYAAAVPLYTQARALAEAAGEQDVAARLDTWIGDANSDTYR